MNGSRGVPGSQPSKLTVPTPGPSQYYPHFRFQGGGTTPGSRSAPAPSSPNQPHSVVLWVGALGLVAASGARRGRAAEGFYAPCRGRRMPANRFRTANRDKSRIWSGFFPTETEAALGAQGCKRVAQWPVGNHHEAREWLTKLEDQEDRSRRRKRKNAEGGNCGCVIIGEEG